MSTLWPAREVGPGPVWGLWGADTVAFLELPEKQEQLAAIYAVLEHLPEANHNSLERLIFHLVKQVPAATLCGGGEGPCGAPTAHSLASVLCWFCTRTRAHVEGSGGSPGHPALTAARCAGWPCSRT